MRRPCEHCGHVHAPDWSRAVGRFSPDEPPRYRADRPSAPLRDTRAEAEADMCEYLATTVAQ